VLGVDTVRTLVLPRVVAITVMMVAFNIIGSALGIGMAMISATVLGDTSTGSYLANFLSNMTVPELVGSTIKCTLVGLFIGVVCAQKGLTARGGPCFAAVWVINFVVNATMLGLNPDMLVNR
jgi:phospholipid/cholesterol/gamma-HCH transport system permease protein